MRTPADLIRAFDDAVNGRADTSPWGALYDIVEDVLDSVALAAGPDEDVEAAVDAARAYFYDHYGD